MLIINKPWLIYENGAPVARVIITPSDMNSVEHPRRENVYDVFFGTIHMWGPYEDLSDSKASQPCDLQHEMQVLLQTYLSRHAHNEVVRAAIENGSLSAMYQALQTCGDLFVRLLSIKEARGKRSLQFINDPAFADGLIYAERNEKNNVDIWESENHWKQYMLGQFEYEVYIYDLYLRGMAFDVRIEFWEGTDSAEMHLDDGLGYDQKNPVCIYNQIVDLYDAQEVRGFEATIFDAAKPN